MRVGIVTRAGRDRAQPVDIAVVVGAEHVDAPVEAPLPLVDVVGGVCGEVGRLTVAADQHAVLVVTEVGGPQPERTLLLEQMTLRAQNIDRVLDRTGLVQRALREPHVEGHAEAGEAVLHLLQLRSVAPVEERAESLVFVQLEQ